MGRKSMFTYACLDSGIPEKYIKMKLENWESDSRSMKFAKRTIETLDEVISKGLCLALIGFYGSGKTFLSSMIAVAAIKQKKIVSYISLFKILTELQNDRFAKDNVLERYYRKLIKSDLVVFNGISSDVWQTASEWSKVAFIDLVSRIISSNQKTMLISNIDLSVVVLSKSEAADALKKEFEIRFLKLILDNFKPWVLQKYDGYSKQVSKKWDEVLD